MSDRDSADLLGYLLAALDDDQHREIDEQLKHDPGLRRKLDQARGKLLPLRAAKREFSPPPGLAQRACALVAFFASSAGPATARARVAPARKLARCMSPAAAPPTSAAAWSWTDLTVAAAVILAAMLVVVPAIQRSRSEARLAVCQDNLRELGTHVIQVSQTRPNFLPGLLDRGQTTSADWITPPLSFRTAPADRPAVRDASLGIAASLPATTLPPFIPAHQGLNPFAFGQNILFADGRAVFVATATWEPDGSFGQQPVESPVSP